MRSRRKPTGGEARAIGERFSEMGAGHRVGAVDAPGLAAKAEKLRGVWTQLEELRPRSTTALKQETETAIQHYEKSLADARANAQGIATETRSRIAAEIESERSALETTLSAKLAEAESRIAATKAKAMQDVHEVAAETAAEIVSELTGATVSKDQAAKAIAGLKG